MTAESRVAASIARLVSDLESSGTLQSDAVRRAFQRVRRHRFVTHWYRVANDGHRISWLPETLDPGAPDTESLLSIYSDRPLVTYIDGAGPLSSSTSPRLMAAMLEALELRPGMRVLEIGTGTGYNAALLAEIVGDAHSVYTVDLRDDVVSEARAALQNEGYGDVRVSCRDGYWGFPEGAPYDRIIATVGCPDVSAHWLDQLAEDGRLLVPLQHGILHPLVRVGGAALPAADALGVGRIVGSSSFLPSAGALRWINPWVNYRIAGLPAQPLWVRPALASLSTGQELHDALDAPDHRDFHFFLSLCARELWYSGSGYGLADPGAGAAVVATGRGVEGFARPGAGFALDLLFERLAGLAKAWCDLGRPRVESFDLSFTSKEHEPALHPSGHAEWVIERISSWEVVTLRGDRSL